MTCLGVKLGKEWINIAFLKRIGIASKVWTFYDKVYGEKDWIHLLTKAYKSDPMNVKNPLRLFGALGKIVDDEHFDEIKKDCSATDKRKMDMLRVWITGVVGPYIAAIFRRKMNWFERISNLVTCAMLNKLFFMLNGTDYSSHPVCYLILILMHFRSDILYRR